MADDHEARFGTLSRDHGGRAHEVLDALLGIHVRHRADNRRVRRDAELLTGGTTALRGRHESPRIDRGPGDHFGDPQASRPRMDPHEPLGTEHHRVGQAADRRHHRRPQRQRRAGVEHLPHHGRPFAPRGERAMRVDQSAEEYELDVAFTYERAERPDVGAQVSGEGEVEPRVEAGAVPAQRHLDDLEAGRAHPIVSVSRRLWQHHRGRDAALREQRHQRHQPVVRPAEHGVVDDCEGVHSGLGGST